MFELDDAGRKAFLVAAKDYVKRQPEFDKEPTTQQILGRARCGHRRTSRSAANHELG